MSHSSNYPLEANAQIENIPRCLLKLKAAYAGLGPTERRVADFVLSHPEDVIRLTAQRLAKRAGTSDSTVVRLCQKIGFRGYPELKLSLARELSIPKTEVYREIAKTDDIPTLIKKAFRIAIQSLSDTCALLDPAQVQCAVRAIRAARRLVICGVGGSGAIAQLAHHKFLRLGIVSICCTDPHALALLGNTFLQEDVVLALSHSGITEDIVEFVGLARQREARIISITNQSQSPLAKLSDIVLCTAVNEAPSGPDAGSSRVAQIGVIDVLCMALALGAEQGIGGER
ncbi:MAG TPA: MurR/RpiR family transcriptional regulator [Firmicutes bacterium]|nr:MurR/RpiR family transcriptional regulator [Bacillota bacterium]